MLDIETVKKQIAYAMSQLPEVILVVFFGSYAIGTAHEYPEFPRNYNEAGGLTPSFA